MGRKDAPVTLACWLDYACPFSAKFYNTFTTEVMPQYGDNLKFVFLHQVQPWHPQSTMLHEAAIAVRMLGGDDAFWKFSTALCANQADYFDANTYEMTRTQIYQSLAVLAAKSAGVNEAEVMAMLQRKEVEGQLNTGNEVTQMLKFYVKYGRQTGIHVSPTTQLNGMVCDTSSGWTLEQWKEFLDPHVNASKL